MKCDEGLIDLKEWSKTSLHDHLFADHVKEKSHGYSIFFKLIINLLSCQCGYFFFQIISFAFLVSNYLLIKLLAGFTWIFTI
jgi:hypothetical protein